nr:MAG: replication associated protein [Arizlama virus]
MPSLAHNKGRGWCFTINNYTDQEFNRLQYIPCQYIVYGKEVGDSGTPHLQGYIHYDNVVTGGRVKANLGVRAHVEKRRGTLKQAIDYCKKDGSWTERGKINVRDRPENKYKDLIQLAEKNDMETIKEEYPMHYFMYSDKIYKLIVHPCEIIQGDLEHEWWYGPTGTGKSHSAWEQFPDHYCKPLNKWWDGYNFQDVVVIEEWSPKNECSAANLKIWADRYPFTAEVKGSSIQKIRPRKIIVTSNYTIKECFPNQQDWEPLMRRFKMVHFPFPYQPRTLTPATEEPMDTQDSNELFDFALNDDDFQHILTSL